MIDLRKDLRHYIDLRRALGYRLRKHEPRLTEFIAFLKAKGTGFVLASEMRGPRVRRSEGREPPGMLPELPPCVPRGVPWARSVGRQGLARVQLLDSHTQKR